MIVILRNVLTFAKPLIITGMHLTLVNLGKDMEAKKTYWLKTKKGVKYITNSLDSDRPSVFGELAQLIYAHCKKQIRGRKGNEAREIRVMIID